MDSGDATESTAYKEEEDDQTTSENKGLLQTMIKSFYPCDKLN